MFDVIQHSFVIIIKISLSSLQLSCFYHIKPLLLVYVILYIRSCCSVSVLYKSVVYNISNHLCQSTLFCIFVSCYYVSVWTWCVSASLWINCSLFCTLLYLCNTYMISYNWLTLRRHCHINSLSLRRHYIITWLWLRRHVVYRSNLCELSASSLSLHINHTTHTHPSFRVFNKWARVTAATS